MGVIVTVMVVGVGQTLTSTPQLFAQPSYFDEQKRGLFPWMARSLDVPLLGTTRILEPQQFLWLPLAASVLVLMAILQPVFRRPQQPLSNRDYAQDRWPSARSHRHESLVPDPE